MSKKIMTLHPEGKQGVNIEQEKYDLIREAILAVLAAEEEVRFKDLPSAVSQYIGPNFAGSVTWYVTTIKLDLEARGLITRIPNSSPQRLRLSS